MSKPTGRTALITGGSKGIGFGVAQALLQEGMNVVITARNQAEVEAAAETLGRDAPGRALGLACDVRDLAAQQEVVAQAVARYGSVDVLVANAGVGHFGSITELTPQQWQETLDINLTGVFNSLKAALPQLQENSGYFISIASLAGTNFFAGGSAYNASKFGLVGFTQAVMLDLREAGVKCTTIMPGSVATHFNDNEPGRKDAWKIQPEDIGDMVVYLLNVPERTLPSKIEVRPSRTRPTTG
jgi:NAD(P)-dependent dehydrogenase (short-subunit alcohol dehydrogenase family)